MNDQLAMPSEFLSGHLSVPELRQRLRWRARRGLLENDVLLTRFLDQNEAGLTDEEVQGFYLLLDLADNELLDLLLQRTEPTGELACAPVPQLLKKLRGGVCV